MQQQRSSGLGSTILVEEEEEEEEDVTGLMSNTTAFRTGLGNGSSLASESLLLNNQPHRIRALTTSALASTSLMSPTNMSANAGAGPLSAITASELNPFNSGINGVSPTVTSSLTPTESVPTPSGVTPLTPVSAMPTGDGEAQLGWMKVADPDLDAFMAYASIVPEFVRLESMLIKSLV